MVLVRKTDGKLRFFVDYRKLNQNTIKDAYALPRIDEIMDFLIESQYFSSLALKMGYYQMEVEEKDKGKTAFTVGSSLGFFEFNRLPFGLDAPASFQRLMEHVMGDLHMVECVTFIDDVIVPGTFHEELTRHQHVFENIRQNGLKLHPRKCILFQRRVKYCGHIVSNAGVETDPDKLVKLAEWPVPTNVKQLRAFLSFAGYYRRFVSEFSRIAKPLTDMLGGTSRKTSNNKCTTRQLSEWYWGATQDFAFQKIKKHLTSPPILAYADYPFLLQTDASADGLGVVLCQVQDNKERVIAYASRSLSQSEKNYPAHKLEF